MYKFLQVATRIAMAAHRGQKYGEHDYYGYHIMSVVARAQDYCIKVGLSDVASDVLMSIAALHDVLEDTGVTIDIIVREMNKVANPDDVWIIHNIVDGLVAITKQKGEGYNTYMDRVLQNKYAAIVKQCDSSFNLNECIKQGDVKRANRYVENLCKLRHVC